MTSHVGMMALFAFFVSVVFAVLMHDEPGVQMRAAARMCAGFVVAGLALGWVLLLFPI
jgi:hypothetical protein